MIAKLFFLFVIVFSQAFGQNKTKYREKKTQPSTALRFANVDFLSKDETVVKLYLYQRKGDPGITIPYNLNENFKKKVDRSRKTIVLFNGHPSSDSTEPYNELKEALFDTENVNIVFVYIDWTKHSITFIDALTLSESFGQFVGDILNDFGFPSNNYHFIAHCAGAEVGSAVAKRLFGYTNLRIPRMTVFDPFITNATKLFQAQNFVEFIDVYHAGIYDPPFPPLGTIDFYPNSGVRQPGCEDSDVMEKFSCHHRRSIYLFTESIFKHVNALEAQFIDIDKNLIVKDDPDMVNFGYMVDQLHTGAYYLPTYTRKPFLMDYF